MIVESMTGCVELLQSMVMELTGKNLENALREFKLLNSVDLDKVAKRSAYFKVINGKYPFTIHSQSAILLLMTV